MLKINNISVSPIIQSKSDKLGKFISGNLESITADDLVGLDALKNYAFYNDASIKSIQLPAGLTGSLSLNNYLVSLSNLNILDLSLTSITSITLNQQACYKITDILLPPTLSNFSTSSGTTYILPNLTNISIDGNNNNFKIANNTLYNKTGTILYKATNNTSAILDTCTNIQSSAFMGLKIKNISIPESVTSMGSNSFAYCYELESIDMKGKGLNNGNTFYYLPEVKTLSIDNNGSSISSYELGYNISFLPNLDTFYINATTGTGTSSTLRGIGNATLDGCLIQIGPDVTTIPNYMFRCELSTSSTTQSVDGVQKVFSYKNHFKEIDWTKNNNACTTIGSGAFQYMGIDNITIPSSITNLGTQAFYQCADVKSIYYDANITNSLSTSSRIFTSTTSYLYPELSVTIGPNVTSVPANLFGSTSSTNYVTRMKHFYFTKDSQVTEFPASMLYNCLLLKDIIIPKTVTTIGSNAFYNCAQLTDIYYEGTLDQYTSNVTKNDTTSYFTNATVHPYADCLHNDNEWRWDEKGLFTTEPNVSDWIIDKESTSCEEGSKHGACNVCGEIISQSVSKLPVYIIPEITNAAPSYNKWENEGDGIWVAYTTNRYYLNNSTLALRINAASEKEISFNYQIDTTVSNSYIQIYNSTEGTTINYNGKGVYKTKLHAGSYITIRAYYGSSSNPGTSATYSRWCTISNLMGQVDGHEYSDDVIFTDNTATCINKAEAFKECKYCGDRVSVGSLYKAHTLVDGYCSTCGANVYTPTVSNSTTGAWSYDSANNRYTFNTTTSNWYNSHYQYFKFNEPGIWKFTIKNNSTSTNTSSSYGYVSYPTDTTGLTANLPNSYAPVTVEFAVDTTVNYSFRAYKSNNGYIVSPTTALYTIEDISFTPFSNIATFMDSDNSTILKTVPFNSQITQTDLPTPASVSGKRFGGWATSSGSHDSVDITGIFSGDVTFYPVWHTVSNNVCTDCGKEVPPFTVSLTSTTGYTWAQHADGYYYPLTGGCQGNKHSTQAEFSVTCDISGTFTYYMAQSTESGCDYLIVYKNGSQIQAFNNVTSTSYTAYTISVTSGDVIKFRYTKDGSVDNGWDQSRIKDISIT